LSRRYNTIFLAIVTCLVWSTAYASIKIGLKYDTPLHFAGARFFIAGIVIIPFAGRLRNYIKIVRDNPGIFFYVTLLQIITNYILFYFGMNLVPGALGAVIVGSQPLVTAVMASLMNENENITRNKILTIISGISGVILISAARQALRLGTAAELLGVMLIIGANIATATSNVLVSTRSKGINPVVLNSFSLLVGGLFLYLLSLPIEKPAAEAFPTEYWIVLAWLCAVSAFGFSTWYKLLQRPEVKVSELNLWKFIIPVFGAIISWIVVPEEYPDLITITGIIIISTSLIFFFRGIKGRTLDRELNK
jgi:drug/metabolite transporter (DMT)-like permease